MLLKFFKSTLLILLMLIMCLSLSSCEKKYNQERFNLSDLAEFPEYVSYDILDEQRTVVKIITTYDELDGFFDDYLNKDIKKYFFKSEFKNKVAVLIFRQFSTSCKPYYYNLRCDEFYCHIDLNYSFGGNEEVISYYFNIVLIDKSEFPDDFDFNKDHTWWIHQ